MYNLNVLVTLSFLTFLRPEGAGVKGTGDPRCRGVGDGRQEEEWSLSAVRGEQ